MVSTHLKKHISQNGNLPQFSGWKYKIFELPPPRPRPLFLAHCSSALDNQVWTDQLLCTSEISFVEKCHKATYTEYVCIYIVATYSLSQYIYIYIYVYIHFHIPTDSITIDYINNYILVTILGYMFTSISISVYLVLPPCTGVMIWHQPKQCRKKQGEINICRVSFRPNE